jgi:hypothetical protein
MTMACIYHLPVLIRPIAYTEGLFDNSYIFVAEGKCCNYVFNGVKPMEADVDGSGKPIQLELARAALT